MENQTEKKNEMETGVIGIVTVLVIVIITVLVIVIITVMVMVIVNSHIQF